jgi:signal transduction histidine kinase
MNYQACIQKTELLTHFEHGFPSEVCIDVDIFNMVLLNLLTNALKFTINGFISVNITSKNDKIAV